MKKIIYIFFVLATFTACKKGEIGLQGPTGDAGAQGAKGVDNTTQGAKGDTGPIGAKGQTGNAGITGVAGTNGTANLVTTDWKTPTWTLGTATTGRLYIAEVAVPEITQDALDKGMITVYTKLERNIDYFELSQGGNYTIGSNSIKLKGFKLGKVVLEHTESTTTGNSDDKLNWLNTNTQKIKILILKG